MFLGAEHLLSFKNGRPFPELSTGPLRSGDLLRVSCGLSGVSWQYPSQASTEEARGRQTREQRGQAGTHICGPGCSCQDPHSATFFFFFLDKSLLGNECTRTGLWLSSPCLKESLFGGLRDEPPGPPPTSALVPRGGLLSRGHLWMAHSTPS